MFITKNILLFSANLSSLTSFYHLLSAGTNTFSVNIRKVLGRVFLASDDTIIITSTDESTNECAKYDLQSGEELFAIALQDHPDSIAEVRLNGKRCIAVSHW